MVAMDSRFSVTRRKKHKRTKKSHERTEKQRRTPGTPGQRKSERGKGESIFSGYTLLLTASGDIEPRAREREQPVK